MKIQIVSLAALAALLSGCGDSSKPGTPANTVSNVVNAPMNYISASTQAEKYSEKQIDLATLNQAVQQFQAGEGRLPKSLQEMVDQHYLRKIPDAPYGYKINYDPATGTVTVVKQ
jgi:hypothetical protein